MHCDRLLATFVGWLCVGGLLQAAEPAVFAGHANVVSSVAFSRDGTLLYSGSWDETVRVWDLAKGAPLDTLRGHEDWVFAVTVNPQGELITATQEAVRRWTKPPQTSSPQATAVLTGLGGAAVHSLALAPDGQLVATGGRDGHVRLWRVGSAQPIADLSGFEGWVSCLSISRDQRLLATGTRAGQIDLFDLGNGNARRVLSGPTGEQIMAVALAPAGNVLATANIDTTVRLWDPPTGKEIGKLSGHRGIVTSITWSDDGKLIATGERHGAIKVWNYTESNRLVATLPGHSDERLGFTVTSLAFSPDAKRIASGGYDKLAKVWTLDNP